MGPRRGPSTLAAIEPIGVVAIVAVSRASSSSDDGGEVQSCVSTTRMRTRYCSAGSPEQIASCALPDVDGVLDDEQDVRLRNGDDFLVRDEPGVDAPCHDEVLPKIVPDHRNGLWSLLGVGARGSEDALRIGHVPNVRLHPPQAEEDLVAKGPGGCHGLLPPALPEEEEGRAHRHRPVKNPLEILPVVETHEEVLRRVRAHRERVRRDPEE